MWMEGMGENADLINWNVFQIAYLNRFFPCEMRDTKVEKFMNLKKYSMLVKEYSPKFTHHSKYALELLLDSRCMSKFVFECLT